MAKFVKVIDGYPGIGKSSWAIQEINKSSDQRILYIVPLLDEVKRIARECADKNFFMPDPAYGHGKKMNNLIDLITDDRNIVTTHQLIDRTEKELIDALRERKYVLYIDEAQQVIHKINYPKKPSVEDEDYYSIKGRIQNDFRTLCEKGFIKIINKEGKVEWIEKLTLSPFDEIRLECDKGHIYSVENSMFIWTFPLELFQEDLFSEIYLMTFRFDTLLQSKFFQYFSIPYKIYHIKRDNSHYVLTDRENQYDIESWKSKVRELLRIQLNKKMNSVGEDPGKSFRRDFTLSLSWYKRPNKDKKTKLKEI